MFFITEIIFRINKPPPLLFLAWELSQRHQNIVFLWLHVAFILKCVFKKLLITGIFFNLHVGQHNLFSHFITVTKENTWQIKKWFLCIYFIYLFIIIIFFFFGGGGGKRLFENFPEISHGTKEGQK